MALINSITSSDEGRSRHRMLKFAAKRYASAIEINPDDYDALYNWALVLQAYYNWAIAISDRAKLHGRTKEAEELWKQATKNNEKAVQLNWNSPQELSTIVPAREKQTIVKIAINKFRAAIWLQFDFHRAIYNLGTVQYGLAEDTSRTGVSVVGNEISSNELYSQSAIYIAAAHALKPSYSIADSWESLDSWLDTPRLVYTIFSRGKIDVLAGIIT
ncbi:hypothetical protein L1987_76673 [Smallanthus sonchifolius]|uniref:Uncharacterized protein n=1 Tax=Smallanthus sonchifolius TaxID=185202 RepID=A0ACB8Z8B3_9ASTR|nr:hypothetical protein L1987_76673 [Smallanthus sonchifolius]